MDWAGAGRGPRLPSLGFLLFSAGARGLRLVDAAVTRYGRHVELEDAGLDRLEGAIRTRPLAIDCWSAAHQRKPIAEVAAGVRFARRLAGPVAERARAGLASG